jgi:hypothetical protein
LMRTTSLFLKHNDFITIVWAGLLLLVTWFLVVTERWNSEPKIPKHTSWLLSWIRQAKVDWLYILQKQLQTFATVAFWTGSCLFAGFMF